MQNNIVYLVLHHVNISTVEPAMSSHCYEQPTSSAKMAFCMQLNLLWVATFLVSQGWLLIAGSTVLELKGGNTLKLRGVKKLKCTCTSIYSAGGMSNVHQVNRDHQLTTQLQLVLNKASKDLKEVAPFDFNLTTILNLTFSDINNPPRPFSTNENI